jgi:hypothetical protein
LIRHALRRKDGSERNGWLQVLFQHIDALSVTAACFSLNNDVVRLVPPPPGAANLACRDPTSLNKHCAVKFAAGNVGADSSKIPAPQWLFIGLNQSMVLLDQRSAQGSRR